MFINFKTNEMQKPTYQEIEDAASRAFQICIETRTFKNGFKTAIKWLLDWQKSQPLTVYVIKADESEMVDVFRTPEKAEKQLSELKKDHTTVDFYIEITILE